MTGPYFREPTVDEYETRIRRLRQDCRTLTAKNERLGMVVERLRSVLRDELAAHQRVTRCACGVCNGIRKALEYDGEEE